MSDERERETGVKRQVKQVNTSAVCFYAGNRGNSFTYMNNTAVSSVLNKCEIVYSILTSYSDLTWLFIGIFIANVNTRHTHICILIVFLEFYGIMHYQMFFFIF